MDDERPTRRRWPRITLVLAPETRDELWALAAVNLRDPKREALRLVLEGLERERAPSAEATR